MEELNVWASIAVIQTLKCSDSLEIQIHSVIIDTIFRIIRSWPMCTRTVSQHPPLLVLYIGERHLGESPCAQSPAKKVTDGTQLCDGQCRSRKSIIGTMLAEADRRRSFSAMASN